MTIYQFIKAKHPRLSVLLADCCNAPVELVTHQHRQATGLVLEAYRKLFLEQSGSVILCSTRPPHFSYVDASGQGSVFTLAFDEALEHALATSKQTPVSWKRVLQQTENRLHYYLRQLGSRYIHIKEEAQKPIAHVLLKNQPLPAFADYPSAEPKPTITAEVGEAVHLILTTNRGRKNPVFSQGDTLQLFVTVSQPCYIRLIDILPDGTNTLLVDNLWVDETGSSVMIQGKTLICEAPFGTDLLQAFASTKPFEPLEIQEEDSYAIIKNSITARYKVAVTRDSVKINTIP